MKQDADGSFSDPVLNANQRRHFEVVLSMLEDSLARIEALCDAAARGHSILTVVDDDLPSDAAARVRPMIAIIRHRIAQLAGDLCLPQRRVSRRRTIQVLLTAEIIRIDDSAPDQLRGYGAVDARYAALVEPQLREIRAALVALARVVHGELAL